MSLRRGRFRGRKMLNQLLQMWREEQRAADSSLLRNAAGPPGSEGRERGNAFLTDAPPEGNQGVRTFGVLMKPKLPFARHGNSCHRGDISPPKPTRPPDRQEENPPAPICILPSQLARVPQCHETLERAGGAWWDLAPPAPRKPRGGPTVT